MPSSLRGLPRTREAVAYAQVMHAGERRADGTPFILHPLEVGALLRQAGAPDHVIAAGVMHDLIEKAGVDAADLRKRFGSEITDLVLAVTDDPAIRGYASRKAALRRQVAVAGDDALMLFAADKLSKLRELGREIQLDGEPTRGAGKARELRARRLRHYQRSLALLEERLPECALVVDLRHELSAFVAQRPSPASAG